MSLVLLRIDDRLVHGQVVEGWLPVVQAERVLVVSDTAARDALQRELMRLALPETVSLEVVPLAEGAAALRNATAARDAVLVLVSCVSDVCALIKEGAPITHVNVGGVHDGKGRRMYAPQIFLNAAEKKDLLTLSRSGVVLEMRALPGDESRSLEDLVSGAAG